MPMPPEIILTRAVSKLFQDTPDDKNSAFGITDGGPIIDTDHPVIKEMFEIPIAGALCCSLNLYGLLLSNPLIAAAAALGWQVITNQRFCLRRAENQGKPQCFRTGCIQASKSSSTFSVRRGALPTTVASFPPVHSTQFFPFSFDPHFFSGIAGGLFHFKKDNPCPKPDENDALSAK